MVSQPPEYPWYATVHDESLEQGDLLESFEVVLPATAVTAGGDTIDIETKSFNVIVMTQSCDLQAAKVPSVLLCPVHDLWEFVKEAKLAGENWGSKQLDALRQGNLPGYHLLNRIDGSTSFSNLSVVNFREVYAAPLLQITEFCGQAEQRFRLLPPYREHMAQAFARFFMRVGLPIDIPKELLKEPPSN